MSESTSRPRRLLVVTFHFTPDGSVGGLRWAGFSKHLVRAGWEIHIVTAAAQTEPPVAGVTIHHCPRAQTTNDRYNALVGRFRSRRRSSPQSVVARTASLPAATTQAEAVQHRPRPSLMRWMRNSLGAALAFPDFGRGWIFRAARVARGLLNEKQFDLIVSSGPPHSAHISAAIASWGRSEPFWVDMRDPWFTHIAPEPGKPVVSTVSTGSAVLDAGGNGMPNAHLALERFIMGRANRVVTNTAKFHEIFRAWYPNTPASFVPNGIDRDRLPAPAPKYAGFSIAYAGTLYLSRNLTPILRALPAVLARIPEARQAMKLRIAGSMDAEHEARFQEEVAGLGLAELIEARGRVPNAEAMDLVNRSHLALVLAQDQPAQIPAKIYECVAMGVPTLVIAESTSAAAMEARRIGAMTCEPDDIAGIERLLEQLWASPMDRATVSTAPIGYEVVSVQMDALLRTAFASESAVPLAVPQAQESSASK